MTTFALPGIGSYIALAIEQGNIERSAGRSLTMFMVILLYDQLIFRPLVVWGDRFRVEQEPGTWLPQSWALTMMQRSRIVAVLTNTFYAAVRWTSWALPRPKRRDPAVCRRRVESAHGSAVVHVAAAAGGAAAVEASRAC